MTLTPSQRDEVVEAMARTMVTSVSWSSFWSHEDARKLCRCALASALPLIERAVMEEAAAEMDRRREAANGQCSP
ncbi:hypothetical protein [Ancylobacter pratisalsi]|uniref:Uncharacterized protein n=1 Tax=Ancylobacter pratisalsi TaxID=1745854 RepID=A0A6P1YHA0_9HYPH|nr:hypothetical protein [Ancylobacter pratisalsi]QIB32668.1 hypothetical protein G3A50_02335 [Ancylobacter pratisalsi]